MTKDTLPDPTRMLQDCLVSPHVHNLQDKLFLAVMRRKLDNQHALSEHEYEELHTLWQVVTDNP